MLMKMTSLPNSAAKFILRSLILLVVIVQIEDVNGHGRLIEPPSRASAWRYGFKTPANYNDHELFCGGYTRQHKTNKGLCGECGDAYDMPKPRPHEHGGLYGQGVVVRKYNPSSVVTVRVELTASHMGYFEFKLCENVDAAQVCLDKHKLTIVGGTPSVSLPNDAHDRFYPRNGSRIYEIKAKLPADLECEFCVLQWSYVAGNNWGICPNGEGAVGCGPQEEFRACSDVSIGKGSTSVIPTMRPPVKTPKPETETWPVQTKPTIVRPDDEENEIETDATEQKPTGTGSNFMAAIIAIFTFFLVLCSFITIYIFYYHGDRLKHFLRRQHDKKTVVPVNTSVEAPVIEVAAPVRPPRTKRLSQSISADESSVLTGTDAKTENLSV